MLVWLVANARLWKSEGKQAAKAKEHISKIRAEGHVAMLLLLFSPNNPSAGRAWHRGNSERVVEVQLAADKRV